MGQTGTPHGVPMSGNGMSPATGGLWDLGCCYLFQPRPGGTSLYTNTHINVRLICMSFYACMIHLPVRAKA